MIEFARAWAFALLPLPLLAWWLLPALPAHGAVVLPASVWQVLEHVAAGRSRSPLVLPQGLLLRVFGWLALVVALAGPQSPDPPLVTPTGRDLLVALDLSASMGDGARDKEGERRIETVRSLAASFLETRTGDRIGLIGFADEAYLVSPLSFDTRAVGAMLEELSIGLAGRRTDLGKAIGLAVQALRSEQEHERLLIILSDGETNVGDLAALDAAALAAAEGITIHMVGFAPDSVEDSTAHMQEVAALTGGRYFNAATPETLSEIFDEIERLAPVSVPERDISPVTDWDWIALLAALFAVVGIGWRELRGI